MSKKFLDQRTDIPFAELLLFGWMPSLLKKWVYRFRGYRIHPSAHLGFGSVIVGKRVEIGPEVKIGMLVMIIGRDIRIDAPVRIAKLSYLNTYSISIGEGTRIGNQVVIGGLQTPQSSFSMGRNGILMEWSFINTTLPVRIGDDVGIGGHCLFFTHGLWPNGFEGFPVNFGGIEIEDQAWLAWRISVLPGVKIGSKSIISTDACVVKDIPSMCLAGGVPAKVLRENGSYIAPVTPEANRARLSTLVDDFCAWVTFHGGKVLTKEPNRVLLDGSGSQRLTLYLQFDESAAAEWRTYENETLLVSLIKLDDKTRSHLDANSIAWMDIASKERSLTGGAATQEFEEFIRRSGLRMLKYGRWN